jgi:peptidyl-prolyl cis-trans isomerase SurA
MKSVLVKSYRANKRLGLLFVFSSLLFCGAAAQDDPVIMTINGEPVPRSEFEYSYNKNNTEGVIDKKSVDEYVDLFINYKLKVAAALDAKLDTLTSFKQEFATYRDQQIRPSIINDEDVLAEAHQIYDNTVKSIGEDGLIQTAHILLRLDQKASEAEQQAVKTRIDSVYKALQEGADFAELAKKVSQDPGSAQQGGELPFVSRGQLVKEYEDVAFKLKEGEMSPVVQTPYGYHIILMKARKMLEPFDYHKESILKFIDQRGIRDRIVEQKLDTMVSQSGGTLTKEGILESRAKEMAAKDSDLKYLIQEYHDGLLLYEISNTTVWDKAAKDEAGLAQYFKKHKKKYNWTEPRYKGMAYHVKDQADVKAVSDCVKKLKFDKWGEVLRQTFNADSVLRIRVEKGIFKKGDHALVDSVVFKKDTTVTKVKGFPIDAVYGKILKKGPEDYTDVRGLVTADYQDELERQWVAELRRKYTYSVDPEVLKTVNKH